MKKILMIISILFTLANANDSNNTKVATELELFLFKIGFQALLSDVDKFGNNINLNKQNIENLQKKVDYILDKVTTSKFENNENIQVKKEDNKKIEELEKQIQTLMTKIQELEEVKKENKTKDKTNLYKVINDGSNIREKPYLNNSRVLKQLNKNEEIEIKYCNKYDWCKLENERGFIAKFLLEKI